MIIQIFDLINIYILYKYNIIQYNQLSASIQMDVGGLRVIEIIHYLEITCSLLYIYKVLYIYICI